MSGMTLKSWFDEVTDQRWPWWKRVPTEAPFSDAREPTALEHAVRRALHSYGWRRCAISGHIYDDHWRFYVKSHEARRFCARCGGAPQRGIYDIEPTADGLQTRITGVRDIEPY